MDKSKPTSFMMAARDFFGLKPDQTGIQFAAECKELSADDKKELTDGLVKQGYMISAPATGA